MYFSALTHVKICGITNLDDALLAARLGANALGFIFTPASPRCVTTEQAKKIMLHLPPFVTTVGVLADMDEKNIQSILQQLPLQVLQFHGAETETVCRYYAKPYIKAFRVKPESNITALIAAYPSASAVLLDSYHPQQKGGSGLTFDWQMIPAKLTKPLILAGGLTSENVGQAIHTVKPYAVDVCSGVEAQPGKKDALKLKEFFDAVKRADYDKNRLSNLS